MQRLERRRSERLFSNCDILPLWNFFKVLDTGNLKYLVITDRLFYDNVPDDPDTGWVVTSSGKLSNARRLAWQNIMEQFSKLESVGQNYHLDLRNKLAFRWSLYLEEQAMIRCLMMETNASYINLLRQRGYNIPRMRDLFGDDFETLPIDIIKKRVEEFQPQYWKAILEAEKRVHYHVSQMEMLKVQIKNEVKESDVRPKDTFFKIITWFNMNDIMVDTHITVSHYVELKKALNKKIEDSKRKRK